MESKNVSDGHNMYRYFLDNPQHFFNTGESTIGLELSKICVFQNVFQSLSKGVRTSTLVCARIRLRKQQKEDPFQWPFQKLKSEGMDLEGQRNARSH